MSDLPSSKILPIGKIHALFTMSNMSLHFKFLFIWFSAFQNLRCRSVQANASHHTPDFWAVRNDFSGLLRLRSTQFLIGSEGRRELGSVIVVSNAKAGYYKLFCNLILSLRKSGLGEAWVLAAPDEATLTVCKHNNFPCLNISSLGHFTQLRHEEYFDRSPYVSFTSRMPNHGNNIVWIKPRIIYETIMRGYAALAVDTDISMCKYPLRTFHSDVDMQSNCGAGQSYIHMNSGLTLVISNNRTVRAYHRSLVLSDSEYMKKYTDQDAQVDRVVEAYVSNPSTRFFRCFEDSPNYKDLGTIIHRSVKGTYCRKCYRRSRMDCPKKVSCRKCKISNFFPDMVSAYHADHALFSAAAKRNKIIDLGMWWLPKCATSVDDNVQMNNVLHSPDLRLNALLKCSSVNCN